MQTIKTIRITIHTRISHSIDNFAETHYVSNCVYVFLARQGDTSSIRNAGWTKRYNCEIRRSYENFSFL